MSRFGILPYARGSLHTHTRAHTRTLTSRVCRKRVLRASSAFKTGICRVTKVKRK